MTKRTGRENGASMHEATDTRFPRKRNKKLGHQRTGSMGQTNRPPPQPARDLTGHSPRLSTTCSFPFISQSFCWFFFFSMLIIYLFIFIESLVRATRYSEIFEYFLASKGIQKYRQSLVEFLIKIGDLLSVESFNGDKTLEQCIRMRNASWGRLASLKTVSRLHIRVDTCADRRTSQAVGKISSRGISKRNEGKLSLGRHRFSSRNTHFLLSASPSVSSSFPSPFLLC